jgi:hypothetical protein
MRNAFIGTDRAVRIPSAELHGTRAQKMLQLDSALVRLRAMQRHLASLDLRESGIQQDELSARAWWLAGCAIVVMFGLLTAWAWTTAADVNHPTVHVSAVHAHDIDVIH